LNFPDDERIIYGVQIGLTHMTRGSIIYLHCEICGEETPHRILRGKIGSTLEEGFDGTVQCHVCGKIHHVQIPVEKPKRLPMVISHRGKSTTSEIELSPRELIRVGDEFYHEDHNLMITSLESGGKRTKKGLVKDIDMIWSKIFDTVDVRVSIVKGSNTRSEMIEAAPDEEFAVGDILDFGRSKVMIDKIRLPTRTVYRQGLAAEARYIKRIYSKPVKERLR
jgi:uncharacterized Zn finger protein